MKKLIICSFIMFVLIWSGSAVINNMKDSMYKRQIQLMNELTEIAAIR